MGEAAQETERTGAWVETEPCPEHDGCHVVTAFAGGLAVERHYVCRDYRPGEYAANGSSPTLDVVCSEVRVLDEDCESIDLARCADVVAETRGESDAVADACWLERAEVRS